MAKKLLFLGVAVLLFAVGWLIFHQPAYEPGTREFKVHLRIFGISRTYLLHTPQSHDRTRALPLVVVLHGGFGTAAKMEKESGFSEISDRENFLVAYPNGFGMFGRLQHWNGGHCCGFAVNWGIDDVGFVSAVIDDVRKRAPVDSSRVYIAGYSNGGMLGYLYAARNPDIIAAVAGISTAIGSRSSPEAPEVRIDPPRIPIPVIAFHGLDDHTIPYGGGNLGGSGYSYVSVMDSMMFWAKADRCTADPKREYLMDRAIIRYTWNGNERESEVVLYALKRWGHSLPTKFFARTLPPSDPLRNFNAPQTIWEFFKAHPKSPVPKQGRNLSDAP